MAQPNIITLSNPNNYNNLEHKTAEIIVGPLEIAPSAPQIDNYVAYNNNRNDIGNEIDDISHSLNEFSHVIGQIPFKKSNVRLDHFEEDLNRYINGDSLVANIMSNIGQGLCCLTGIGALFMCSRMQLINEGEIGFSMLNGKPKIYFTGRQWFSNPLNIWNGKKSFGDDVIVNDPITIIRVPEGSYGLAFNNSVPEILLPGISVRKTTAFKFQKIVENGLSLIVHGPIKLFIVASGEVQVCYDQGKVKIFPEGRYAVNSAAFRVAHTIKITQANMRFSKHPVLLDGGISLLVEGLLTFKVVDVQKLITELGDRDLNRCLEDVTKAEIARVFAGLHLEQISSATVGPEHKKLINKTEGIANNPLGTVALMSSGSSNNIVPTVLGRHDDSNPEGEERSKICSRIISYITPFVQTWGVKVINFQLESTKIADEQYAREYEQASLGMAKAKANLRSVDAENEIKVRKAQAKATVVEITAQAARDTVVIEAEAEAEARKLEFDARNSAANIMNEPFAKTFAFAGQQVEFAKALNANVLTVVSESAAAKVIVPMFNNIANLQKNLPPINNKNSLNNNNLDNNDVS